MTTTTTTTTAADVIDCASSRLATLRPAVRYHGSITYAHGPAQVVDHCYCEEECAQAWAHIEHWANPRYVLRVAPGVLGVGSEMLEHVRRESFTVEATQ